MARFKIRLTEIGLCRRNESLDIEVADIFTAIDRAKAACRAITEVEDIRLILFAANRYRVLVRGQHEGYVSIIPLD